MIVEPLFSRPQSTFSVSLRGEEKGQWSFVHVGYFPPDDQNTMEGLVKLISSVQIVFNEFH